MPADWIINQGDTAPLFYDELTYDNGAKIDLTGATVTFVMRALTSNRPLSLTGKVTVITPAEGKVAYEPSAADSAVVGNYMTQWAIVFAGGEKMTVPTEGYSWVQVQENLSTEGGAQIVGLPEVKDYCNIREGDHTHDTFLVEAIGAVAPLIENLTGPILAKTYDEYYEGGHSTISLRHKPSFGYGTDPVLILMAVSEYRGPIEYELSIVPTPTQGSVYSVMANPELGTIVRRVSGGGTCPFWEDPEHPQQSVHVVYYAGQATVPPNVKQATLETIRWWHDTTQMTGKGSLAQADEEVIRPMVALPYHCEAMLAPTRRHPSLA